MNTETHSPYPDKDGIRHAHPLAKPMEAKLALMSGAYLNNEMTPPVWEQPITIGDSYLIDVRAATKEETEDKAAFIVHAANNIERVSAERDALLEALKKAKKYVPYGYSANPLHDEIDAAITSVEGAK
jgi:hypothetical protein